MTGTEIEKVLKRMREGLNQPDLPMSCLHLKILAHILIGTRDFGAGRSQKFFSAAQNLHDAEFIRISKDGTGARPLFMPTQLGKELMGHHTALDIILGSDTSWRIFESMCDIEREVPVKITLYDSGNSGNSGKSTEPDHDVR